MGLFFSRWVKTPCRYETFVPPYLATQNLHFLFRVFSLLNLKKKIISNIVSQCSLPWSI